MTQKRSLKLTSLANVMISDIRCCFQTLEKKIISETVFLRRRYFYIFFFVLIRMEIYIKHNREYFIKFQFQHLKLH